MIDIYTNIEEECQRIEERCMYSSKGHYNASEYWGRLHYWIGIPMVGSAFMAGFADVQKFINSDYLVLFALVAGLLGVWQTFLGASERASKHKVVADQYLDLEDKSRQFRIIHLYEMTKDDARNYIAELRKERQKINAIAPKIPNRAYKKAKKGIDEGQATYEVDDKGNDN